MRINNNIQALNAYRNLATNQLNTSKSLEKLSSGLRINRAADDAAGLAISEKMRSQIRGLGTAERNALDAISLIQTAEGAMDEVHSILQRMRELAVQGANDTNTDQDREQIQKEINQLTSEVNRIGNSTEYNTKKLLNESVSSQARTMVVDEEVAFANGGTTIEAASILLEQKSSLGAGNYSVKIEDTATKKLGSLGDAAGGVSGVAVGSESSLDVGSTYGVKTEEETIDVISNNPAASTMVDGISIMPDSIYNEGDSVNLKVERLNRIANYTDTGTGLVGVTFPGQNPELDPSNSFEVAVNSVPTTVDKGTLADDYIKNLQIDSREFTKSGSGFELRFEEVPTESGVYSVSLFDDEGNALSDPVVLDQGAQDYRFFKDGETIGVSFDTVSNINSALDVDLDPADTVKKHTFDINKEVVVMKDGSEVFKTVLTESDEPGTISQSVNGLTYAIEHNGFGSLNINNAASFGISSDLTYSTDGVRRTFTPGDTITLDGGILVNTSSNLSDYETGTSEVAIEVGSATSYTAKLVDSDGSQVDGSPTIVVGNNGAYNFGGTYGVSFTTDTLVNGTRTFTIGEEIKVNATLEKDGEPLETLENISANSSLQFNNGELSMNIASLANGTASFGITGGTVDKSLKFQVGANQNQTISLGIDDIRANMLNISSDTAEDSKTFKNSLDEELTAFYTKIAGVNNGNSTVNNEFALDVTTHEKAAAAVGVFDYAISRISSQRSNLGAIQNRLEHTVSNLKQTAENLTASESRIRDVDMALEMTTFTKNNILNQAAQSMLAQANQLPQGILQLLNQ
ncbi:flagellin [Cytobacillus sp. S13-E01]|uniref:flagellin N-terminal helical domain-containing protein n=1 Tax=Cytobacillus sp. S13-E01 TaxID=3031326 RepID=UPI0023D7D369|nr:flagellin [Cytobacillus sp. S13-E01]MDF0726067.1 flagellin [Cytobacillus sp. S13-E01]